MDNLMFMTVAYLHINLDEIVQMYFISLVVTFIFDLLPSLKANGIPTKDGQARPRECFLLH